MSGEHVKRVRLQRKWTQKNAAKEWGVSQPYLSMMEKGKRPVPDGLAHRLARDERSLVTELPLTELTTPDAQDLPRLLGELDYPGFAYLSRTDTSRVQNPASVVMAVLRQRVLSARVTAALPWLLLRFHNLNWKWLLREAKLSNTQNRLGYLVSLARETAEQKGDSLVAQKLRGVEQELDDARLAKEDSLGRALTEVEGRYLRANRPEAARHWNVLTTLRAQDLRDA